LIVRRRVSGPLLLWATLAALAAHVVWALLSPHYTGSTGEVRLVGLLIANSFGFAAGITVLAGFVIWRSRLWRGFSWAGVILVSLGAVAIKEGVSRTAFVATIIAIFAALFVRNRDVTAGAGRRVFVLAGLVLGGLLVLSSHQTALAKWFQSGDTQLATLTNRTLIWNSIVPHALDHPFVGLGPGALRFDPTLHFQATGLGQAHNALVEALIGGGVIGAALWICMMLALGRHVLGVFGQYRVLAVSLWLSCVIYSITMGQLAGFGMPWFLLMALLAMRTRLEGSSH
jgi:O-antigen ligase